MSAELIEQGAPRCGECGMPLVMHHDPGCSQPCAACWAAMWRRLRRETGAALVLGAAGFAWGAWLFSGAPVTRWWAALVLGAGLFTGYGVAMVQRWFQAGRKR